MRAGLGIVALLAGTGLYWQARSDTPGQQPAVPATSVRTVRTKAGSVEKTLRLTGVIAPERFASMLAPQLRGSRGMGGGGGGGRSSGGGGGSSSSGSSSSRSSGSSSGSSSSSSGGSSSSASAGGTGSAGVGGGEAGGIVAGSAGIASTGSGTSGLRSALSRFSTPTATSGSSSSSSRSSSSASSGSSSSSSSSSLGSTASSLGRGGGLGGGGGGGDFTLILQSAVPPGTRVKKGEVIAEFDRQYMLNRLDDWKANLDQQEASLASLKANLAVEKKAHAQSIQNAKAELDKSELDLKTLPVQSDIDRERLKLAAEEARARYKQLLSEIRHKEAAQTAELRMAILDRDEQRVQFGRMQANADRMLFRAPVDGLTVMGTTFRGGEFGQIQPGDQVHPGMMFMRVVDPTSMIVNATVNQVDIENVRIGMKAQVRFDAYPDLVLPARVHAIAAMPKSGGFRAQYVKDVPVVLKLDRMDPRVIPDLSVSADVVLESESGATVAPVESVFRDETTGKPFVWVQTPSGWTRRDVELGVTSNVAVAIRSGVERGEVLAGEWPLAERRK